MAQQRRTPGSAPKRRLVENKVQKHTDDVAYTPAKTFYRKKLMLQLVTVVAVALAVAIGLSIFFKVDAISVSGLEKYNYDTVVQASGIQDGDSLVFFSRAEVSSKILQALPYVRSIRIGIMLPGTVNILIEEVSVAYAVRDQAGAWWLISADGTVLEQTDGATATMHTTIEGVHLMQPVVGEKAVAQEQASAGKGPETVLGADRLKVALQIAQALEKNELLGEFSSIDVSSIYDLRIWHGKDYQFKLGDHTQLDKKVACMAAALPKILADYPAGTLDVSNPDNSGGFPFTELG